MTEVTYVGATLVVPTFGAKVIPLTLLSTSKLTGGLRKLN